MEYEEALERSIQHAMSNLDGCCRAKLPEIARRLVGETPPYPPGHLMTVARFVFVLAYRVFNTEMHPDAAPGWVPYEGEGADMRRFLDYVTAVLRLNDAVDAAAREGKIKLNERISGTALADWRMPDKKVAAKLQAALLWEGDNRAAAETLIEWQIWYPHITDEIVVEPRSFIAWLESEGIAAPGETMALINALKDADWVKRGYAGYPKQIYPLLPQKYSLTSDMTNDVPAINAPSSSSGSGANVGASRNKWGEFELRRLMAEKMQPDASDEKLALRYGVSRQQIGKLLQKARELYGPKKAGFADSLKR